MKRTLAIFIVVVKAIWAAIFHVGRFLNLWEPDNDFTVVSISKVAMWLTLGALCWVLLKGDSSTLEIALTGLSSLASTGNYAYRRSIQARMGAASYRGLSGGYGSSMEVDMDCGEMAEDEPFEEEPEVDMSPETR